MNKKGYKCVRPEYLDFELALVDTIKLLIKQVNILNARLSLLENRKK